eukprot:CAMPEP_0119566496 /NCGR_PEP_ID=MMETSP1352-20130426/33235_1 /TAXON_ID=265584 /ORGANISM="Stauroneis constricta, Strain CCMP1120" /LENGTH=332 /DNA_ID=CAMNT_0007615613 /DNA_START=219 /DNA_END=1213 /DNA_ORIENTATION=+
MTLRASATNPTTTNKKYLIIDFDGTCTESDTTCVLPKLAALQDDNEMKRNERIWNYKQHETEYFEKYGKLKDNIMSTKQQFQNLDDALNALDDVSTQITRRVSQSGCLAGLPQEVMRMRSLIDADDEFGEALRLREDCVRVVSDAHATGGWKLGVLSINWCRTLIDAVLIHPIEAYSQMKYGDNGSTGTAAAAAARKPEFDVWCNALDEDGKITLNFPGAISKRECIADLRKNGNHVVYVGDSATDLLALLEADVGILIGGSSSASGMAERWGVNLVPIADRSSSSSTSSCDKQEPNTVWTTCNWKEIEALLKEEHDGVATATPNVDVMIPP